MFTKDKLLQIFAGIRYFLISRHYKGHGIHSPAIYELVSEVLHNSETYGEYKVISNQRHALKRNGSSITVSENGAGSKKFSTPQRKISDLISIASVNEKYSRLLFRLARHYQPSVIIELGTSVGISIYSLYLGSTSSKIITMEAEPEMVNFTQQWLSQCKADSIELQLGNFDDLLPQLSFDHSGFVMVYIDGNHTYEATLRYFNFFDQRLTHGIIVIDDIYWSAGMTKAWKEICAEAQVSVDLYRMGLIFKQPSITPGKYRVRF